jgi:hypothetical protein
MSLPSYNCATALLQNKAIASFLQILYAVFFLNRAIIKPDYLYPVVAFDASLALFKLFFAVIKY